MDEPKERRIAALEAELASVRTEMQQLVQTVSHDLRAPLRHIVSFARLVEEDAGEQLSPEVLGFLSTITDSANHLGALLDGLLVLSRAGTAPLQLEPTPTLPLVKEVCAALAQQHAQRSIDWQLPSVLPDVWADGVLLRQALNHVLGNAVKFTTPRAHAVIAVSLLGGEGANTVLEIADNGVGYNPAHQDKLFRVFGRLHGPRDFEGVGVGLVTTRKLLQRMGGMVDCESGPSGGCRVVIRLPSVPFH